MDPRSNCASLLEPLFVKYGVNVVFSGHDHVYERLKPQKGIYYFVSGAGGQLRKGNLKRVGHHRRRLRSGPELHAGRGGRRGPGVPSHLQIGDDGRFGRDPPGTPTVNRAGRFALEHFLAVPIGVVIALVWANAAAESYFTLSLALSFVVNNVGMALFFALVTQEVIEAMVPGGALHTWRRAMLPIVAAIGGTIGAIGVYQAYLLHGRRTGAHDRLANRVCDRRRSELLSRESLARPPSRHPVPAVPGHRQRRDRPDHGRTPSSGGRVARRGWRGGHCSPASARVWR